MVSNYYVFLAQLWRFTEVKEGKGKLENKKESTKWEHLNKHSITIPKANGEKGYIEVTNKDGSVSVLGVQNSANDSRGLKVIFKKERNPDCDEQKWLRGPIDLNGWFTLQNVRSLKYLTAENATSTIITG